MWEGRAAGKPRDSAAHLGVGTSLLPAPQGCLCKSVARSVFWEPFTGSSLEKNYLYLAATAAPGSDRALCSREVNPGSRAQKAP